MINSDATTAKEILKNIENASIARLDEELKQSKLAIEKGEDVKTQVEIIAAWEDWYVKAAATTSDLVSEISLIQSDIEKTQAIIKEKAKSVIEALK